MREERKKNMQSKNRKHKKLEGGEGFTFAQGQPFGLSIGALLGAPQKECATENKDKQAEPPSTPGAKAEAAAQQKISKVALQRQRAGRGGKTVTLVILPQDYRGDRAALAKELRKGLGCGSTIEDGKIVLQGDIADRAEVWFIKKGVRKITKSA